jgi:hypothetical protein
MWQKNCPLVVVGGIVSKSMTIWEKVFSSIIGRACGWGCETTKKKRSPPHVNNNEMQILTSPYTKPLVG